MQICVRFCAFSRKTNYPLFFLRFFQLFCVFKRTQSVVKRAVQHDLWSCWLPSSPSKMTDYHLRCTFPFPFSNLFLLCLFDAAILIWNDWIWSSQVLDLSYNSLSSDGILSIGLLPHLKVLHLTGNQLCQLPPKLGSSNRDATQLLVPYCPWSSNIKVTQCSCLSTHM